MGHNDHIPVPDPQPKPKPEEPLTFTPAPTIASLQVLGDRIDNLRVDLESDLQTYNQRAHDRITSLCSAVQALGADVRTIRTNLKQTILAVSRLAQGKSLGALGLPSEESWSTKSN